MNSIDKGILSIIWRKTGSNPAKTWEPTLRTAVLMFSDQQLVTGIALLTSGYVQLDCGLSAFHWQMIVYLAWFSSLTHLTTLTVLRQYFRDNPGPRLWRSILMLVMVSMLGFALLPTGDYEWLQYGWAGQPALCYFKRLVAQSPIDHFETDLYQTSSMITSITVLFFGYLTRLIKLSNKATIFVKLWVRTRPGRVVKGALVHGLERAEQPHAFVFWRLQHLFAEMTYVLLRAFFDIFESIIWEVRISLKGSKPQPSFRVLIFSLDRVDALAGICPRLGDIPSILYPGFLG